MCISCRGFIPLKNVEKLGTTPQARFRQAYSFARATRIDLASAYSVLLGIIPLENALSIPETYNYDSGFREAVEGGFLTPQQACERGDRVLYASTIGLNHAVDMKLAFLVADNRMTLDEALKATALAALPPDQQPKPTGKLWGTVELAAAAAMICLALLAMVPGKPVRAMRTNPGVAAQPPTVAQPAEAPVSAEPPPKAPKAIYTTDGEGRLTQVSARDPESVLLAYCNHEQFAKSLSPIALTPAVPPRPGVRLGLVRDLNDLSAERCISIRRDRRTGKWASGDGRRPIERQPIPKLLSTPETHPLQPPPDAAP